MAVSTRKLATLLIGLGLLLLVVQATPNVLVSGFLGVTIIGIFDGFMALYNIDTQSQRDKREVV